MQGIERRRCTGSQMFKVSPLNPVQVFLPIRCSHAILHRVITASPRDVCPDRRPIGGAKCLQVIPGSSMRELVVFPSHHCRDREQTGLRHLAHPRTHSRVGQPRNRIAQFATADSTGPRTSKETRFWVHFGGLQSAAALARRIAEIRRGAD